VHWLLDFVNKIHHRVYLKMLSSSSSSPSLSVFTKPSSSSKKPAKRAKAKARPLPTPPSFHQNSRSDQQVTAPTINKNSPLHLTYKLKPDSPFQNYTTPKTVIPAKASQHVKRTTVHSKLSENPILSETKKISYMLHPPPDPQYFTSFLESTIPKVRGSDSWSKATAKSSHRLPT